MQPSPKVLVVGTTTDYVDWIRYRCPGSALFLTDRLARKYAHEAQPAPAEEIVCDLSDLGCVRYALHRHLQEQKIFLIGITSYDCESMELAATLATDFDLPYPSIQAVRHCRNKYVSKVLWNQNAVACPRARLLDTADDAIDFLHETGGSCVLKPLSGSGSELVFSCENDDQCRQGFEKIVQGLHQRLWNRLYIDFAMGQGQPWVMAEEFVSGEEFSCDFVVENEHVEVIRLCRKILSREGPFGTALGYVLLPFLSLGVDPTTFQKTLCLGAKTLGISRAICMADFLVRDHEIVLLEMTPRPGGDCLPHLLRRSWNIDILQLTLDFARQQYTGTALPLDIKPCVGLRVHAKREGVLRKVDTRRLNQDPRVLEVHLTQGPGHVVRMPPADYDSWVLGHIIFLPAAHTDLETQCNELLELFEAELGNIP